MAPGDHVVLLTHPANCLVATNPQSVTLSAGGMIRDTAAVNFSVSCLERRAALKIVVTTTGTQLPYVYRVLACQQPDFYCSFYSYDLGAVAPNGTLVVEMEPGLWDVWLADVPTTCVTGGPQSASLDRGETVTLRWQVSCP